MLLAMLLMALSTYMLSQGAPPLQKEALNYMGMAMVGYVLSGLARSETRHGAKLWRETLVFFRRWHAHFTRDHGLFCTGGIVLAVAHDWRRNWRRGGALLLITLVLFVLGIPGVCPRGLLLPPGAHPGQHHPQRRPHE